MEKSEGCLKGSAVVGSARDANAEEVRTLVHGESEACADHFEFHGIRCLGKERELFSLAELGLRFRQGFFRGHREPPYLWGDQLRAYF